MPEQLDAKAIINEVQSRLGIGLSAGVATIDGGIYQVLRPVDLEEDHGFFVAIARTPRQVTASVHFDPYAGRLFRFMSEADEERQSAMWSLAGSAHKLGMTTYCNVELSGDASSRMSGPWRSLEIEVSARISRKADEKTLCRLAIDCASYAFALPLCLVEVEDISSASQMQGYPEGAVTRVEVNRYERSPANRAACLAFHGTRCLGCGFDFELTYGPIAAGFIEVHHLVPVSQMGKNYVVDPLRDLIPLCSNCHSVVHRSSQPLTLEQLRNALRKVGAITSAAPNFQVCANFIECADKPG